MTVTEVVLVEDVVFQEIVVKARAEGEAVVDIPQIVHFQEVTKVEEDVATVVVHRNLTEEIEISINVCLQVRGLSLIFAKNYNVYEAVDFDT